MAAQIGRPWHPKAKERTASPVEQAKYCFWYIEYMTWTVETLSETVNAEQVD